MKEQNPITKTVKNVLTEDNRQTLIKIGRIHYNLVLM